MNVDLFNQALLLVVSFLTFGTLMYSLLGNDRIHYVHIKMKRIHIEWSRTHLIIIVALTVIMSVAIRSIVQANFPQDTIPWELVGWAIPLSMAIVVSGYSISIRAWRNILVSAGSILCAGVLACLLANNYYHYYPTPSALFEQSKPAATILPTASTTPTTANTAVVREAYYSPLANQPKTGTLKPLDIPASGAFSPRQGRIYLPPALEGNDMITLPVIVLLPGFPGTPIDWEQAGILAIMNEFAAKHKGLAPIVAVVDPLGTKGVDTECVNSTLGDAETYLAKDVPNYLKAHYQVSRDARDWTIAGYSAGGTCSTLLALRNPSVYQNYINISGDAYPSLKTSHETLATLFGGSQANQDAHTPNLLLKKGNPLYKTMHAWYFVGEQDNPIVKNRIQEQMKRATEANITVMGKSMSGHHSFLVWKTGYVDSLPWMMNQIRLTVREQ